jgi:hypothetical protein
MSYAKGCFCAKPTAYYRTSIEDGPDGRIGLLDRAGATRAMSGQDEDARFAEITSKFRSNRAAGRA